MSNQGNIAVEYEYNEWGEILSITNGKGVDVSKNAGHIANLNPFRYRSYYFDQESGFYYLMSRYYDPEVGRFINADELLILLTKQGDVLEDNLYTYCINNPLNFIDKNGEWYSTYRKITSRNANCLGYVMGLDRPLNPYPQTIKFPRFTVKDAYILTLNYINHGLNWYAVGLGTNVDTSRNFSGRNSKFYVVAVRIIVEDPWASYHYAMQHENGTWSHKAGGNNSEFLGKDNYRRMPGLQAIDRAWGVRWTTRQLSLATSHHRPQIMNISLPTYFYDSQTYYIAVLKRYKGRTLSSYIRPDYPISSRSFPVAGRRLTAGDVFRYGSA